jgi:hypothetical protein
MYQFWIISRKLQDSRRLRLDLADHDWVRWSKKQLFFHPHLRRRGIRQIAILLEVYSWWENLKIIFSLWCSPAWIWGVQWRPTLNGHFWINWFQSQSVPLLADHQQPSRARSLQKIRGKIQPVKEHQLFDWHRQQSLLRDQLEQD